MTSGPSPSTAQWRLMPLVATVRCSRAIAGRHSEGATALSNRRRLEPAARGPNNDRDGAARPLPPLHAALLPRRVRHQPVDGGERRPHRRRGGDAAVGGTPRGARRARRPGAARARGGAPRYALHRQRGTRARRHLRAGAVPLPAARTRDAARRRVVSPPRLPHRRAAWPGDVRGRGRRALPAGRAAPLGWLRRAHLAPGAPPPGGDAGRRGRAAAPGRRALLPPRHLLLPAPRGPRLLLSRRLRPRVARPHRRARAGGGDFEIEAFQPGLRHDQASLARVRVVAPSPERLEAILAQLIQAGARVADEERDARLEPVERDGVAPHDFYSTSIFPTDVRVRGRWVRAARQRMDAVLAVDGAPAEPRVTCRLIRELAQGDLVVCGVEGVRIEPTHVPRSGETFGFMTADASSERRVELAVERIAWEMRRLRERDGKIVVVASPVAIHTGGGPHLARLVHRGYVHALLGGNGLAAHDIEQALFGTSLGVDLKRGINVQGGHRNHLVAINLVRAHGSIRKAVEAGALRSGVIYECVRHGVPFALAGSIRDDGPLPDTLVDLIAAQAEYARLIEGADMILMLASMLHSIGVGNMTPAGVRLICVDISPAVVTKLADRGSVESTGIVTDVGLFLNLLGAALGD